MKLPKHSIVCSMCDEIVTIDKSKPVIYSLAIYNHGHYYMIEDIHWTDICGACFVSGQKLPGIMRAEKLYFHDKIVRLSSKLKNYSDELKDVLINWVLECGGNPQIQERI